MAKFKVVHEIEVEDLKGNPVEMEVYQHENGGLFAIDSSYIEQVADEDDTDNPLIADVFNKDNDYYVELTED